MKIETVQRYLRTYLIFKHHRLETWFLLESGNIKGIMVRISNKNKEIIKQTYKFNKLTRAKLKEIQEELNTKLTAYVLGV